MAQVPALMADRREYSGCGTSGLVEQRVILAMIDDSCVIAVSSYHRRSLRYIHS
jgi:hypothetical protein